MIKLEKLNKGGAMDKLPTEKRCSDCGKDKPVNDFKKDPGYKDGRFKRCRECERKRIKSVNAANQNSEMFKHDKYYSY